jgi:hypothetical protein
MPTPQRPTYLSATTWGGTYGIKNLPIEFDRGTVILRPSQKQLPGALRAIEIMRQIGLKGAPPEWRGMCSRAQQIVHARAGVPGWAAGGMGDAAQMPAALKKRGYTQVTGGNVQPGDIVVYTKGGQHIGIATGYGPVQTYGQAKPAAPRFPRQRGSNQHVERPRIPRVSTLAPPAPMPFKTPQDLDFGGKWDDVYRARATREPALNLGERTILEQIGAMIPDMAPILQQLFLE